MDIIKKIKNSMMSKVFYLVIILIFNSYSAQEYDNLGKMTENIIKLYLKDRVDSQKYTGVTVYEDTISKGITIETLKNDFNLYKKTQIYKWVQYNGSKIVIFCDFSSKDKCNKIFDAINLSQYISDVKILDQEPISYELDGDIRQWSFRIDDETKINRVNGKFIEDEIKYPKLFRKFLKKYSVLKLFQLSEGGSIIKP